MCHEPFLRVTILHRQCEVSACHAVYYITYSTPSSCVTRYCYGVVEYTFCQQRNFSDGPRCCSGVDGDPSASNVCSEGNHFAIQISTIRQDAVTLVTFMSVFLSSSVHRSHFTKRASARFRHGLPAACLAALFTPILIPRHANDDLRWGSKTLSVSSLVHGRLLK